MNLEYRQSFGLEDPPAGTEVRIEHMAGLQFHVVWPGCPDGENILAGWIPKRGMAEQYVADKGYVLTQA